MAGGGCTWSRRVAARMRTLRGLVRDTQRALQDVSDILNFDPEILTTVQEIGDLSSRPTALVILGTYPSARARLLHCLLGRRLLPDAIPRGCGWIRIQYGSSTQVHMTVGNSEFELVEDLECNKGAWDTLPIEDLLRREQTDLSTILEVELNNQFLKDGIQIIVPPDFDCDESQSYAKLKQMYHELYAKRGAIMKTFNPVYLFAIDRIGKNIFSENICDTKIINSRSEEDFWNNFNLYSMMRSESIKTEEVNEDINVEKEKPWHNNNGGAYVFTSENCLDLHQVKEINPNSQLLFVLLNDSVDVESLMEEGCAEATESTEGIYDSAELPESDQGLRGEVIRPAPESPEQNLLENRRLKEEQTAFMNELLDQWEYMCNPPKKHYVRSQWIIIDDFKIMRTCLNVPYDTSNKQNEPKLSQNCKIDIDEKVVRTRCKLLNNTLKFAVDSLQSYVLEQCTRLSEIHVKLLQQFILASFDLARELQVVPKKIQYVATQEQQLYEAINNKFSEGEKKQELLQIMQEVLGEMTVEINNMDWSVDDLPCHQDQRFVVSNSVFYSSQVSGPDEALVQVTDRADPTESDQPGDMSDVEEALSYNSYNFDDYDIVDPNDELLNTWDFYRNRVKLEVDETVSISSRPEEIQVERDAGSMSVTSSALASAWGLRSKGSCPNTCNVSIKQASLDVQQTVLSKLSRKISLKLVDFVDCLSDSYFGTLQRCLESLERRCGRSGSCGALLAVRRLALVTRRVQLQPDASFSLLTTLRDSIRRLLYRLRIVGGLAEDACCVLSPQWRRHVALHAAQSLSPQRLARLISSQILERLSEAHEKYQSALASLESALTNRLHHTEDVKLAIRKKYAPAFARLCLESTSMCDLLMYGTPELGREIGRGQYGVVYSVRGNWAGYSPVAVKSVLPADKRHYHELAMEFFYTRSIPEHERIVRVYGSVVQRGGSAEGGGGCVLLVSRRLARDLHAALRAGLPFAIRMRISIDIVEGIRYLHSLGLVHRDIKMKNVLLDSNDRAALSDLGFCAAEALMSGSVVGTPVHMAPELLHGDYHAAVDVYAFGILFWYVCAGNVKLPSAFEMFQNKEQLWSKVKKGLRPERLPHFSDECWEIMKSCWASEPSERALLGDVQLKLERIYEQALKDGYDQPCPVRYDISDDDSLNMTGIEQD